MMKYSIVLINPDGGWRLEHMTSHTIKDAALGAIELASHDAGREDWLPVLALFGHQEPLHIHL